MKRKSYGLIGVYGLPFSVLIPMILYGITKSEIVYISSTCVWVAMIVFALLKSVKEGKKE